MSFNLRVTYDKCNVSKIFTIKHFQKIFWHLWFWDLDSNWKHPYIIETEFTIISSKNVQLSFHNIGSVSASWSWFKFTACNFFPVVIFNIKDVHIVHPMNSIISSEIDNFWINKASCSWNSSTWLFSANKRLDPCKGFSIEVKYVIKLSQLIGLSAKDIDLFIKGNGWMLKSSNWWIALSSNRSTPFQIIKIKN